MSIQVIHRLVPASNVRTSDWYTDTDQEGNVIDVPMSSFTKKLQTSALSVADLLQSKPAIYPLSHVVKNW